MRKPDETNLWNALLAGEWPRDAGRRLGIHDKRVTYLCLKWTKQGTYDYGVCADLGWPTAGDPRAWTLLRERRAGELARAS